MSSLLTQLFGTAGLLSEEDAAAFAAAHQLGRAPEERYVDSLQPERQVTQWIGGNFVCWEEFWLKETQTKAIKLIAPEARWLTQSEAAHLICASRSQGQLEMLSPAHQERSTAVA